MRRVQFKLGLLLAVSVFLLSFCNNNADEMEVINGKYEDRTAMLSLELHQSGDTLIGTHCFVTQEGKRIDCCLKEDGASLKLVRSRKGVFEGTLASCYDEKKRDVKITIDTKGTIKLDFVDVENFHPFISKEISFIKTKSS